MQSWNEITKGILSCIKGFNFYSEQDGKLSTGFAQRYSMM